MLNKSFTLQVENIAISGQLYLPGERAAYPAVCICHGIPARPADPSDRGYPLLAERLCGEGLAAAIFNFRGAGKSGGNLDMPGWTRDLKAVVNYLWDEAGVDRSRLYLLGFSGGAAVSVYVASQEKRVSGVVACACPAEFTLFTRTGSESIIEHFRSIGVIRDADFPRSVEEWLDGFSLVSPIRYVAGIAPRPLLLVHGSDDETVNVSHAHRLYEKAGEPKQLAIVDGAGHRLRLNDRAMGIVSDWLKSHCRR